MPLYARSAVWLLVGAIVGIGLVSYRVGRDHPSQTNLKTEEPNLYSMMSACMLTMIGSALLLVVAAMQP